MLNYRIIQPIVEKVEKITGKEYRTSRGNYLIFDNLNQLEIVNIAFKEFAPMLIGRDDNKDKNHNKRLMQEKQRVLKNAKFFAVNKEHESILTNSMIKTKSEALNIYIREIKNMAEYLSLRKKQIEDLIPFFRDTMLLIADEELNISKELFELHQIINKDVFSSNYTKKGTIEYCNIPNEGWL